MSDKSHYLERVKMSSRLCGLPLGKISQEVGLPPSVLLEEDSDPFSWRDVLDSSGSQGNIVYSDVQVTFEITGPEPIVRFTSSKTEVAPCRFSRVFEMESLHFWYGASMEILEDVARALAEALKNREVAEVEYIIGFREDGFLCIWTIMNDADYATRLRVYDAELEVGDRYYSARISFRLIRRGNRLLDELVSFPPNKILVNL
jgi:hypothetical protein